MSNSTIETTLAKARLLDQLDPDTHKLFLLASKLGITHVEISFSGSGDSGDINETELYRGSEIVSSSGSYGPVNERGFSEWADNPDWTPDHQRLEDLCREYFNQNLSDRVDWDWYNNDGGGGDIKVNFTTGHVEISGYYYAQHDADGVEFNLLGEEEEAE
jgi:hypothetical protein